MSADLRIVRNSAFAALEALKKQDCKHPEVEAQLQTILLTIGSSHFGGCPKCGENDLEDVTCMADARQGHKVFHCRGCGEQHRRELHG